LQLSDYYYIQYLLYPYKQILKMVEDYKLKLFHQLDFNLPHIFFSVLNKSLKVHQAEFAINYPKAIECRKY